MEIRAFTFLVPPVAMSFTSGLVESCINAAVHVGFCEFRGGSGPKKRRQLRLFSTRFWKILDGLHNQNTLSDFLEDWILKDRQPGGSKSDDFMSQYLEKQVPQGLGLC